MATRSSIDTVRQSDMDSHSAAGLVASVHTLMRVAIDIVNTLDSLKNKWDEASFKIVTVRTQILILETSFGVLRTWMTNESWKDNRSDAFMTKLTESIEGCTRLLFSLHTRVSGLARDPEVLMRRDKKTTLWTESGIKEITDCLKCQASAIALLIQCCDSSQQEKLMMEPNSSIMQQMSDNTALVRELQHKAIIGRDVDRDDNRALMTLFEPEEEDAQGNTSSVASYSDYFIARFEALQSPAIIITRPEDEIDRFDENASVTSENSSWRASVHSSTTYGFGASVNSSRTSISGPSYRSSTYSRLQHQNTNPDSQVKPHNRSSDKYIISPDRSSDKYIIAPDRSSDIISPDRGSSIISPDRSSSIISPDRSSDKYIVSPGRSDDNYLGQSRSSISTIDSNLNTVHMRRLPSPVPVDNSRLNTNHLGRSPSLMSIKDQKRGASPLRRRSPSPIAAITSKFKTLEDSNELFDSEIAALENALPAVPDLEKFRILIIGQSGVGKSTLCSKILGIDEKIAGVSNREIGTPVGKIWEEVTFPGQNDNLILHDSGGFEAGSKLAMHEIDKFIKSCAQQTELSKQLHCIWYCISCASSRPIQEAEKTFFSQVNTDSVPIIVVFTQYDKLVREHILELMEETEDLSQSQARKIAAERAFRDWETHYKGALMKIVPHNTKLTICRLGFSKGLEVIHEGNPNEPCGTAALVTVTLNCLQGDGLRSIWKKAQRARADYLAQVSIESCIDYFWTIRKFKLMSSFGTIWILLRIIHNRIALILNGIWRININPPAAIKTESVSMLKAMTGVTNWNQLMSITLASVGSSFVYFDWAVLDCIIVSILIFEELYWLQRAKGEDSQPLTMSNICFQIHKLGSSSTLELYSHHRQWIREIAVLKKQKMKEGVLVIYNAVKVKEKLGPNRGNGYIKKMVNEELKKLSE